MTRVLYVGTLQWGSTSLQRMESLRGCVAHLYATDVRFLQGEYGTRSVWQRVQLRCGLGGVIRRVSEAVIRDALRYRPDLLWVDQGLAVGADAMATVRRETGAFGVHYTADSLLSPGFGSRTFRAALREYDLCITTKPAEADLYRRQGAARVLLTHQGFDPQIHRPMNLDRVDQQRYGCEVAFVGQRMEARAASLVTLRRRLEPRARLHLYGRGWEKRQTGRLLGPLQKGWVAGAEYAKALCGAKICLAFLNREVGDVSTTRTFEIPACGAFLLAERTEVHQELFAEGVEAEYFGSDEELIEKTRWYLARERERRKIAAAGYVRCQHAGYSWRARMQQCLDACRSETGGKPAARRCA